MKLRPQSHLRGSVTLLFSFAVATFSAGAAAGGEPAAAAGVGAEAIYMPPSAKDEYFVGEDGRANVFVELRPRAALERYAEVLRRSGEAAAVAAAQDQIRLIESAQESFETALQNSAVEYDVLYEVERVLSGIALRVDPEHIDEIRAMPGVLRVEEIPLESLHNSNSMPLIGAPAVWDNTAPSLPRGSTGQGIRIGIIDTGIDYQHAMFGGTGTLAAYQANDTTVITDGTFPTAKVVGGTDFVGNAYTGGNAPVPDPDPMDCNGHGSHVAGTAAGFGVNPDGTPYAGPWASNVNYRALRLGPGAAPQAQLYALRVFGCGGSTAVTVAAIEWATDPNQDGNFADHLDVINMSLGSNFGSEFNTSSIASDRAALAGVVVVASAGNAGDTFFISGSPGASTRTISVANTLDNSSANGTLSITNPPAIVRTINPAPGAVFAPAPPAPPAAPLSGQIVYVDDGSTAPAPGGTGTGTINDGCTLPFVNAAAVSGNIALIDRGLCSFKIKARNAQSAGAIGVVIANNSAAAPIIMGTDDTVLEVVGIPAVMIPQVDGNDIKANLAAPVNVTFGPWVGLADTPSGSTSRGARGNQPIRLKPDVAAPGTNIPSAQTGITCTGTAPSTGCITANGGAVPGASTPGFLQDNRVLTISGTSMAAPHIAGVTALLRDLYPRHSVEEIKALVVNYATQNVTNLAAGTGPRLSASRVGSGRIRADRAAAGTVTMVDASEPANAAVAFEPAVLGSASRSRRVRIFNHGSSPQTFDVGLDTVVDAPGVAFDLPGGGMVTVPARSSTTIEVRMSAEATLMDHVLDPAMSATQTTGGAVGTSFGAQQRHWLTEESSYLTLSQSGNLVARVPVYVAPYPQSRLTADDTIVTGGAPTGSTNVTLSGQAVCTGTVAGGACTGTAPADQGSVVTPFELQAVSPRNPAILGSQDIRHVGVAHHGATNQLMFGISTWAPWTTPTETSFTIDIDCGVYTLVTNLNTDTCAGAPDGVYDLRLFSTNQGNLGALFTSGLSGQDVFVSAVIGLQPGRTGSVLFGPPNYVNKVTPNLANSRIHDNNVQFVTVDRARVKVNGRFNYRVSTCPGFSPICGVGSRIDSIAGPLTWDHTTPGLDFGGGHLAQAQNGTMLPVTWNTASFGLNGSLGGLLLHHYNEPTRSAEPVALEGTTSVDLGLIGSISNPAPAVGTAVTLSYTLSNPGPANASSVQVSVPLPVGLTLNSASPSTGTFASGVWTVGALASGTSATLGVLATVDRSGPLAVEAAASGAQLDPNPGNDIVRLEVNAPASADMRLAVTPSSTNVVAGQNVTLTLSARNAGVDQAYNVDVVEQFTTTGVEPLAPIAFVAQAGTYDGITGLWQIASQGQDANPTTLALTFTVPASLAGQTLSYSATVASDQADPNLANNTASAVINVQPSAGLSVSIADAPDPVTPTDTLAYTITLDNAGPNSATNVVVTDTLPSSVRFQSITAPAGFTCVTPAAGSSGAVQCSAASVPAGTSQFTLNATLGSGVADGTVIVNSVSVSAASFDADTSNNSASTQTTASVPAATPPVGSNAVSTPSTANIGDAIVLSLDVAGGTNPPSTGITVTGDLSSIGGTGSNAFTSGAGSSWSFGWTIPSGVVPGAKSVPVTVRDAQGRSSTVNIALTVRTPTAPTGSGLATPSNVLAGGSVVLTYQVTPGTNPTSTGIAVTANLASINGGTTTATPMSDDGTTGGDVTANDGTYTLATTVAAGTAAGPKLVPVSVADAQGRSHAGSIVLNVPAAGSPTGVGLAQPAVVLPSDVTTLTVTVNPGTNPASTGLTVRADLSAIGGNATQAFRDDGTSGDQFAGDLVFTYVATVAPGTAASVKNMTATISDAQTRSGIANIRLDVRAGGTMFSSGFEDP